MQSINKIYGQSPSIQESIRSAELIAATDVTTLIIGETGTEKALFAQHIVQNSPRKNNKFSTINCATLPSDVIEAYLFGTCKKKASEQETEHRGIISKTHNGTLFIEEIAELPLIAQSRLLHFLENGECVGYKKTYKYNVRIIVATNKNLLDEVKAGRFRKDLFYRLNIVPIQLPPLKDRLDDTTLLINLFFQDLVKEYKLSAPNFTKAAKDYLKHYLWPGNVRELRNFCERMLIIFSGKTIDVANLPAEIRQQRKTSAQFIFELPSQGILLEELEMDLYQQAIQTSRGNKSAAARLLGLSRDAFLYRLKKHGLR